jgi:hypothetical protein
MVMTMLTAALSAAVTELAQFMARLLISSDTPCDALGLPVLTRLAYLALATATTTSVPRECAENLQTGYIHRPVTKLQGGSHLSHETMYGRWGTPTIIPALVAGGRYIGARDSRDIRCRDEMGLSVAVVGLDNPRASRSYIRVVVVIIVSISLDLMRKLAGTAGMGLLTFPQKTRIAMDGDQPIVQGGPP